MDNKIYKCNICNKVYKLKGNFIKHINSKKCLIIQKQKNQRYTKCKFCQKEILNFGSLKSHEKYCNMNPNKANRTIIYGLVRNTKSWNKGLTKYTDQRIAKGVETFKKTYEYLKSIGKKYTGLAATPEKELLRRKKISETGKKRNSIGGFRKNAGRGKKGWYKGYFCDSSWELAYVIYNLEHNINFKRNTKGFEYEFNGNKHKYYPDFILEDGTYVQIKGYMTEKNKIKIESFKKNYNLIIIDKILIIPYIKYAENKYGKDFIKLYEK